MRQIFSFWWLCVKRAAKGNAAQANDWQWVIANPLWQSIGTAVGGFLGAYLAKIWQDAPAVSSDTALGVFLGGFAGFAITWLLAFAIKLIHVPAALYFELEKRVELLSTQLSPTRQLRVSFNMNDPGCVRPN